MKPGSHCYGNLCWEGGGWGGYMVSPQNPLHDILMFAFMLCMNVVFFLKKKKDYISVS